MQFPLAHLTGLLSHSTEQRVQILKAWIHFLLMQSKNILGSRREAKTWSRMVERRLLSFFCSKQVAIGGSSNLRHQSPSTSPVRASNNVINHLHTWLCKFDPCLKYLLIQWHMGKTRSIEVNSKAAGNLSKRKISPQAAHQLVSQ